jgi:hypothetical protein
VIHRQIITNILPAKISQKKFTIKVIQPKFRDIPIAYSMQFNSLWTSRAMAVLWTIGALLVSCATLVHDLLTIMPRHLSKHRQHVAPKQRGLAKCRLSFRLF